MKTLDPKKVVIVFGSHQVSGYADGDFIKVARAEDAYSLAVGADGEGARVKSNNRSGTVEITIMQTSASNDVLSSYAQADENDNAGLLPLLVKDNSGRSLYAAEQAYIKKQADSTYNKQVGSRTYVIETDVLQMFNGGN